VTRPAALERLYEAVSQYAGVPDQAVNDAEAHERWVEVVRCLAAVGRAAPEGGNKREPCRQLCHDVYCYSDTPHPCHTIHEAAPEGEEHGGCEAVITLRNGELADARAAIREAERIFRLLDVPTTEWPNFRRRWLALPAVVAAVKEEKR